MASRYELIAWLHGTPTAVITERRTGKISLEYTDDASERWDFGDPVLSVGMSLSPSPKYPPVKVAPFLEGLLPEGQARNTIEARFGVRRGDTVGLLTQIGRDCAGAVTFQSEGDPAPPFPVTPELQRITQAQVIDEIEALGVSPLGADAEVRVSLAGQQDKLLLARDQDGTWARPVGNTPSTHILKPQDERYPDLVANEAFCLRAARLVDLTSIEVEVLDARGRPVLVVSRYDREVLADGTIFRIHQEDLCQALSLPPKDAGKYEEHGGPSLRAAALLLDTWAGRIEGLDQLARAMLFNVAVGNADAHGKNLSLLHHQETTVMLAPLYDIISTVHYPTVMTKDGETPVSTKLAMTIGGVTDINDVTLPDLVREVSSWNYDERRATKVFADLLGRLPDALNEAASSTAGLPDELVTRIIARVRSLLNGAPAGA